MGLLSLSEKWTLEQPNYFGIFYQMVQTPDCLFRIPWTWIIDKRYKNNLAVQGFTVQRDLKGPWDLLKDK